MQSDSLISDLWTQHQRKNNKTTKSWACEFCIDRRIFGSSGELWEHALEIHPQEIPTGEDERRRFRDEYVSRSAQKRSNPEPQLRKAATRGPSIPSNTTALSSQAKRPFLSNASPAAPSRSLSGLKTLNIGNTKQEREDSSMNDVVEEGQEAMEQPRKRAAIGDGISAGSASPLPFRDSVSPPPNSQIRPTSISEADFRRQDISLDSPRPHPSNKKLWTPDSDAPLTRSSIDPANFASTHVHKSRAQGFQSKSRRPFQPPNQQSPGHPTSNSWQPTIQSTQNTSPSIINRPPSQILQTQSNDDAFELVMQPETRPISQEQLVAEVKGIYAGLVMVEAKCIEIDSKQATLASATPGVQPQLKNEQWQALIALHRTLLHEHHDFFLASQHPSASPALRRLASKYAMPARMWRHGIHSFLELLRHRLPDSLDHMLAFIYLAYSMMALLYETVPAFEDTWIECLGDLGRYRMAIEDDDIKDREVWTGVARHWYSKASDKAPTTGRLYHHLAILARPNVLMQLFYYAKSLCVAIPFISARESILTLFEPVMNAEKGKTGYKLPPLESSFIKAHGILFTNKDIESFESTLQDFLSRLDSQIGRVTRKFMEQGYHISVANSVALLSFASAENALMKAIQPPPDNDVQMEGTSVGSISVDSFKNAQRLSNATLEIVLRRLGDPNVLSFIHATLVFMHFVSRYPEAMKLLQVDFPWELLAEMLNTLLVSCDDTSAIESEEFPVPEKDSVRPFPEDYAMRGLLWADQYFPEEWFKNEKIDEAEKYHERASMTPQRKERNLWLGVRIARSKNSKLVYTPGSADGSVRAEFSTVVESLSTRSLTFASATTESTINRAGTWGTNEEYLESDTEEEGPIAERVMVDNA